MRGKHTMPRRFAALLTAVLALAAAGSMGPGTPAAFAADEQILASGSTWSANAMNQWQADEQRYGVDVQFTPSSSGQGRSDFAAYQNDFANSDIPFQGTDPLTGQTDTSNGRAFAYIPIVAGGTSFMYRLFDGKNQVTNVRLSGQTITKIFTGRITMWNDPQITADMNGHALPAKKIQVVVESNGSGTTAQFTDWMAKQYADLWKAYAGQDKPTSYYPVNAPNITAENGDAAVAGTIDSPGYDGAIGYLQYSYPLKLGYPVVKVENSAGYFTTPTPYNAAVALTRAQINTANPNDPTTYLTQDLTQVYSNPDPRSYPLSSYSYSIIPIDPNDRRIDTGKAKTFADFAYYFLCQGQDSMPTLGYSPLTINLVQDAFAQVAKYSHIQPADIQNRDATTCNNPTYYPQDPAKNRLAEIDPAPQACDRAGQGPCGTSTAGQGANTPGGGANGAGGNSGSGGSGGAGANPNGAGPNATGANNAGGIDPETGLPYGQGGSGSGDGSNDATSTELAAFRSGGMNTVFGVLAAVEVVLVLLVPAFVARAISRRKARNNGES